MSVRTKFRANMLIFLVFSLLSEIKKTEVKLRLCAHERSRTFTSLRTADFESAASTNSATWAFM